MKSRSIAWKQRERDIAEFHSLVRNPLSGANSGRIGDAYDPLEKEPWVYIEAKHYERHAALSIFQKHELQVKKKFKHALCAVALSENRKHGFWMLVHSSDLLLYAAKLLTKHGYTVTKEGEANASHDHIGSREAGESS